ncbi:bifunctional glutamate N-acetyltransferase/amino-acid acetyltransferase ArgJ [Pelagibaculum spongiae]|uniref:Arginine biosynthesis bifunctional protein ArgJ n=1 Tax=Pelagibaculum spongiae TaxID=2080658 RepID=A0A2V1H071_9GAMM|nr:bifunctional glutamate N-acetyltransferase/amino-acid acetyltransferase ArgJ [Pelagibaculum spongiae]PVZ71863.1 bifunctional ornithine acetyltransferase/N-acetylglutamate synthase [Pelagibaculum spongiae]
MAVGTGEFPEMNPVKGFALGTTKAGVRYPDRKDLVIMSLVQGSETAATFTKNRFCAAPVTLAKQHMQLQSSRYWLVNTGNANAGTGQQGMQDALDCCAALAKKTDQPIEAVLPFSTGVIGEKLSTDKVIAGLDAALSDLNESGWLSAAQGIMTTDTRPKGASIKTEIAGKSVTLTGMSKGAGMICPNMATMLGFAATDVKMPADLLQQALAEAVNQSFNSITVDGDTSTNDACMLAATGQGELEITSADQAEYPIFCNLLNQLMLELAQAIVCDGEGATKLIEFKVINGASVEDCREVGYTLAHSPLVKTAFFACDPNWGRMVAAIGRAKIDQLDIDAISLKLGGVALITQGQPDPTYTEQAGQQVMDQQSICVTVDLAAGNSQASIWTTDLSHEYVTINADYRS